jgi:DNA-binding phage protein
VAAACRVRSCRVDCQPIGCYILRMDTAAVIRLLRDACRHAGGEAAFARRAGISRQMINAVLTGKRQPRGRLLDVFGLEFVASYRRKATSTEPPP